MLRYDHELMRVAASGQGGIGDEEFRSLLKTLDGVRQTLAEARRAGNLAFASTVETGAHLSASVRAAAEMRKRAKTLVVVGIGGSDLGAKALIRALGAKNADVRFAGASVDPETISALLDDIDPKTVEAIIVRVSDGISGGRPGARRDSVENYIKRLTELENIANSFPGVDKSFAIQAGREVRIIVRPSEVDDLGALRLSKDIARLNSFFIIKFSLFLVVLIVVKIAQIIVYPGTSRLIF